MITTRNRKQVRGWKRQIARVAAWRRWQLERDVASELVGFAHAVVRIDIDPWFRLERREPPCWLRRLMLAALLDVHASWRSRLAVLGEPCYLAVWLYHPSFIESQVVAGVREQVAWYRGAFVPAPPWRPFPHQLALAGAPLASLSWTPHADLMYLLERDDDLTPRQIAALRRRADRIDAIAGDTQYALRRGDVWIGSQS